jgi:hypothetical protein
VTWFDLVHLVAWVNGQGRHISNEEADFILWEYTAFPFADATYIARQLETYFRDPSFVAEQAGMMGDEG